MKLTPNEIAHCIATTALPESEWVTAVAIALAESRGDTDALGVNDTATKPTPSGSWGSYDCGLWQVNNYWHGAKMVSLNWRDPYQNAELAYRVWVEGKRTWNPWATFKDTVDAAGKVTREAAYKKYLPHAAIGVAHPVPVAAYPPLEVSTQAVDLGPIMWRVDATAVRVDAIESTLAEVRSKFS